MDTTTEAFQDAVNRNTALFLADLINGSSDVTSLQRLLGIINQVRSDGGDVSEINAAAIPQAIEYYAKL